MSKTRKRYFLRLIGRILILLICGALCFLWPEGFSILDGMNFFGTLSPFHLLWAIWVLDMILQIIPIKNKLPLGSMKLFASRFRPIRDKINYPALRAYVISTTKAAYKVMLLWLALLAVIAALYFTGLIGKMMLFMISVAFYVCDLICVLIWCPFRLIMKNKCCTSCRIYNWDYAMMFTPLLVVPHFVTWSLLAIALLLLIRWGMTFRLYPERFSETTNACLACKNCNERLCQHKKQLRGFLKKNKDRFTLLGNRAMETVRAKTKKK